MSYLFFDIEAANRHEGVAKIYSFGYVKTDKEFKVMEKDEIIVNPDAEYFFTKEGKHVQIPCPVSQDVMSRAKLFPESYNRIKKLLTTNICVGYGTPIDAHMLHESCKRYDLPSIDFKFYDVVEIADEILQERIPGLNKLAEYLGLVNDNPHNGLSDAFATYEVCKKMLEENNRDINAMRYNKHIYMYQAKDYKVFRMKNNRLQFVPKAKFKDMKIQEVQNDDGLTTDSIPKSNAMREAMLKWLNQE
jgi:DNA polymerase III alpha subunit (gram-positive type)